MKSDFKHAIRRLLHDWQFSTAAVVILALGIGMNTAVFSVVNAVLFGRQPFSDSGRLVNLYQNVGDPAGPAGVSFPAYRDIAANSSVFSAVTAVLADDVRYQGRQDLQLAIAEYTTSSYLDVAGYRLHAGRWFTEAEDRAGPHGAVVIGYRTWQKKFAADPGVLGQTIRLNGAAVTVIGIGPRQLASSTLPNLVVDFWLSMSALADVEGGTNRAGLLDRRGDLNFEVRARLKDGVSIAQARAAMDLVASRLKRDHPDTDPGKGITVVPTDDVVIHPGGPDTLMSLVATVVMAIIGLVLAIACSNLATLLLVRGTGRAREVSVRLAIGATRWQLVRHFLTESVLLAVSGALGGFVLAIWTLRYLATLLPISFDVRVDDRVFAFTLGLSLVTGIAFGLAPALRSTRIDLLAALRGESGESISLTRGWFTLKNILLAGQVMGSFVLLIVTAFLIRAVMLAQSTEPGFAVQGVALISTNARYAGYGEAEANRMYQELLRRIATIPGVQSVFAANGSPVGSSVGREIEIEGVTGTSGNNFVESTWGSPGYFETLEIPLLYGRTFKDYDLPGRPRVAIVNETMARRVFGTSNAVGRTFRYGGVERSQEPKTLVEIVGVVRDVGSPVFNLRPEALFYLPVAQAGVETTTFGARTSLGAAELVQAMQREVRALDSSLDVLQARTMEQLLENQRRPLALGSAVLGGLGVVALALASIGLYAVVRFAVSKRSVELGIRIALGARSVQVVWLVMRDVAILTGVSIAMGTALSIAAVTVFKWVARPAPGVPVNLPAAGPATLLAVVLVMAAAAGAASYFPARRAAKADPSVSLRHQ
jgi:predicted permease